MITRLRISAKLDQPLTEGIDSEFHYGTVARRAPGRQ